MALAWLTLAGFRSYPQLRWRPSEGINLLVGPNGVGKTNLLEAVGVLFTAASFRGAPDRVLVSSGGDTAVVRGETDDEAPHTVELQLHRRERRRLRLNGARVSRVSDLARMGRLLVFIPEHLDLVKGGPAQRRQWLDDTAALLWPVARADQSDYHKALRQRNAFLKAGDQEDRITLEVWDQRLSSSGARVMAARARALHEVLDPLSDAVTAIAGLGEKIAVAYRSGWGGGLDPAAGMAAWQGRLRNALENARRRDFRLGATTIGPHRDEPIVTLNGADARLYASQGEQRTLALALRLGAFEAVEQAAGCRPVLVLDDVFSELDSTRAEALVEWLPTTQTFISAVDQRRVPIGGEVWKVAPGDVR
ncbi:MAG: DNA replication and repair protein RecF [Actinomycetia bacterium]|nr:DNA replication and repair protein RecF [Actinomycetes bacterium]